MRIMTSRITRTLFAVMGIWACDKIMACASIPECAAHAKAAMSGLGSTLPGRAAGQGKV
jgi:hypothetical protein